MSVEKRRKIFAVDVEDVLRLLQSVGAVLADAEFVGVTFSSYLGNNSLCLKTAHPSFDVVPEGDVIPTEMVDLSLVSQEAP